MYFDVSGVEWMSLHHYLVCHYLSSVLLSQMETPNTPASQLLLQSNNVGTRSLRVYSSHRHGRGRAWDYELCSWTYFHLWFWSWNHFRIQYFNFCIQRSIVLCCTMRWCYEFLHRLWFSNKNEETVRTLTSLLASYLIFNQSNFKYISMLSKYGPYLVITTLTI